MKRLYFFFSLMILHLYSNAQNGPWNNALRIARSTDGINFSASSIFQDSAGVPSVIKWKGDTLIAAFQWFRQPNPSPTWDRVATKISFDNGLTWTEPAPIVMHGMPSNYQRPFDPTLTLINNDSLRIYFSSAQVPVFTLDSNVNTYSAVSGDGVNFYFENGIRVDEPSIPVIDPAVIYFKNTWHYAAPYGAPQQGTVHYLSPDGKNFSKVPNIMSDNLHNWTGNYVAIDTSELRFYGSGQFVWFNSSSNGGVWNGYVNTNINGGDPSVVKISASEYLMIYVGMPGTSDISESATSSLRTIYDPVSKTVNIENLNPGTRYQLFDIAGRHVSSGSVTSSPEVIDVSQYAKGTYVVTIPSTGEAKKFVLY